jgi:hypothetical protein
MEGCIVAAGSGAQPDTVRIALPGAIDPRNAPAPRNESEKILFGHLYETLISIDCEGEVHPGLASDWYEGDGGRRWTFVIRRGARFWDGSPVTPGDIVRCWQNARVEPFIWEAGVDSAAAAGQGAVHVYFSGPRPQLPRELASPAFAVARIESRWPLGTTGGRINVEPVWSGVMYRRPFTVTPLPGRGGPVLVFIERAASGSPDQRDLIEGGADVMITGDPDVIEYAAGREHLEALPLPWSRVYVLLSIERVREFRLGGSPPGLDPAFSASLARDAVPGISRGHEGPGWYDSAGGCPLPADVPRRHPMPREEERRIVFDRGDPVARSLAERILALAGTGPGSSPDSDKLALAVPGIEDASAGLSIEGLTKRELETSLAGSRHYAYITWVPVRPADPCAGLRDLYGRAPWLTGPGGGFPGAMLPLVETRIFAVVRGRPVTLTTDWFGRLRAGEAAAAVTAYRAR